MNRNIQLYLTFASYCPSHSVNCISHNTFIPSLTFLPIAIKLPCFHQVNWWRLPGPVHSSSLTLKLTLKTRNKSNIGNFYRLIFSSISANIQYKSQSTPVATISTGRITCCAGIFNGNTFPNSNVIGARSPVTYRGQWTYLSVGRYAGVSLSAVSFPPSFTCIVLFNMAKVPSDKRSAMWSRDGWKATPLIGECVWQLWADIGGWITTEASGVNKRLAKKEDFIFNGHR